MSKPKGEKCIGIRYTARLFIIIFTFILAIGAAAPALSATWTQTDWVGGPTKPELQVGQWADSYDNFYDNENVDWSQAGGVRLENFLAPASGIADHVVISEVYADVIDETGSANGEFVELYNPTSSPIVMTNWKIGDNDGWENTFSGTIPAYGFFIIAIGNYNGSTNPTEAGWPAPDFDCATTPKMANGGDEVWIMDGAGNFVDVFGYGSAAENWEGNKFPTIAAQGQSYERKSGPIHDNTKGNGYDTNNNANDFYIRGDTVITTTEAEPQNTSSPTEQPSGTILAFRSSGLFESSVYDAGKVVDWKMISWSENKPVAGFNFTQLTNLVQDRADAVWSPDMSKIAFQSMRSGSHQIWVMNADGTTPQQLTFSHGGQPSWSPDGSRIAYWRYLDNLGISSIMTMKPDGTDQQVVINMGDHPTWSPDGTRIAFTTAFGPGSKGNIWRVNADGTGLTQLTFGSYWDWGPAWSPLGDKIAFSSDRDGTYEIWTVNVDGSGLTKLTELNNPLPWYEVSWCPDGSKLAFEYDNNSPTRIWTINADGTNPQPFVVGPTPRNIDPCWSPDGTKILFTSDDPGDIWVAEIQHIDIVVKLRTGDDDNPYDGGWSEWYQHNNGAENTLMENGRYVQYRVELSTTDNTKTPEIFDIILIYELVGDNTPPPAPTLISPENGDNILDNTPTFKWTSVSDPSGVTYQIQIDDNVDFSSPVYYAINLVDNTHALPDENALALFIQYFWHVRAKDGVGNIGDWSEEWNFTVVPIGAVGVLLMPLLMLLPFAFMLRRQNRRYP